MKDLIVNRVKILALYTTFFFALAFSLLASPIASAQSVQASPPSLTNVATGIQISRTDSVTTGFDVYVDGIYTTSLTLSSSASPIIFSTGGSGCTVTAAAWVAGGLGHSVISQPITDTSNSACALTTPITGPNPPVTGGPFSVCIDSIAYNPQTSITISSTTHCF